MAILRDTSLQSRYHYARLRMCVCLPLPLSLYSLLANYVPRHISTPTPTTSSSSSPAAPIDSIALLSLAHKALGEWFGPAGGVSGVELQVVLVEEAPAALSTEPAAREAVLRFPAS